MATAACGLASRNARPQAAEEEEAVRDRFQKTMAAVAWKPLKKRGTFCSAGVMEL